MKQFPLLTTINLILQQKVTPESIFQQIGDDLELAQIEVKSDRLCQDISAT
jgi:hypothetical protein